MKIVLIFLTLVCTALGSRTIFAAEEVVKQYYPSGKLKYEWHFREGKRHGPSILYFEGGVLAQAVEDHGSIRAEANFKNGKLDGRTREYYENGAVMEEASFKEGKPHGVTRLFREDGKLQFEWNYDNGTLISRKKFDEQGTLEFEKVYQQNTPQR